VMADHRGLRDKEKHGVDPSLEDVGNVGRHVDTAERTTEPFPRSTCGDSPSSHARAKVNGFPNSSAGIGCCGGIAAPCLIWAAS
jgi:hypothetical protein